MIIDQIRLNASPSRGKRRSNLSAQRRGGRTVSCAIKVDGQTIATGSAGGGHNIPGRDQPRSRAGGGSTSTAQYANTCAGYDRWCKMRLVGDRSSWPPGSAGSAGTSARRPTPCR